MLFRSARRRGDTSGRGLRSPRRGRRAGVREGRRLPAGVPEEAVHSATPGVIRPAYTHRPPAHAVPLLRGNSFDIAPRRMSDPSWPRRSLHAWVRRALAGRHGSNGVASFLVLWSADRITALRNRGELGQVPRVLYGSPHTSAPRLTRYGVSPGDTVYVVMLAKGVEIGRAHV